MRFVSFIVLILMACGPGWAQTAPPPVSLSHEGNTYYLLHGLELKKVLLGSRVKWRECSSTGGCTDEFWEDGHEFGMTGDRSPYIKGVYETFQDHYCMTTGSVSSDSYTVCKALLRSSWGGIIEIGFYEGRWHEPHIVDVTKRGNWGRD